MVMTVRGCFADPWNVYAMDTPPDVSCRTGHLGGWDVWIWTCVDGERVAIGRQFGEMYSGPVHKDTAACGGVTDLERDARLDDHGRCGPGRTWGGDDTYRQPVIREYAIADSARSEALLATIHRRITDAALWAEADFDGTGLRVVLSPDVSTAQLAALDRALGDVPGLAPAQQ
jgi:hypothetical protein